MSKYHSNTECYCDRCCDTATSWWQWESLDGALSGGSRYWTIEQALADKPQALQKQLRVLAHIHPEYPAVSAYEQVDAA